MGLNVDIDFTGNSDITPNTIMSHNLLRFAENNNVSTFKMISRKHYFTDGNVLGIEFLLKVAVEAGLSAEKVRAYIESEEANESPLIKQIFIAVRCSKYSFLYSQLSAYACKCKIRIRIPQRLFRST